MNLNHFALSVCVLLMCFTVFAQPRITDQGVIGGDSYDWLTSMDLTSDGGLIIGGYSASDISGQKTQNSRGRNDYWIVKLGSNRVILWDKTIGESKDDYLLAVQQTTDGGYIVGGYTLSGKSGDKTGLSRGSNDYWIVKLDANGNIQWDKTIGGSRYDDFSALQQTGDGGYILGGYSLQYIKPVRLFYLLLFLSSVIYFGCSKDDAIPLNNNIIPQGLQKYTWVFDLLSI